MLIAVSVKTLAEFVHRRGDLYPPSGGRVTPEEGLAMQRHAQRGRSATYQREVAVAGEFPCGKLTFGISGRADGCDLDAAPALIEEIKTTRADPTAAEQSVGSSHWAQARLYAALLARDHPDHDAWRIRLLYCHPDTREMAPFEQVEDPAALAGFLADTIEAYGRWMAEQLAYQARRDAWLEVAPFPYPSYRPHQRALAGRVYRAFQEGEHLLLEAPTGSGKTMGVLYPALKALAAGHMQRLFYLTSRGTGARAVSSACEDVDVAGRDRADHRDASSQPEDDPGSAPGRIRVVNLIAKEKACLVPGMPCQEGCEYALGYYDRIQGALTALLAAGNMGLKVVRSVAEAHRVCPFELSLDGALWADLVIGDYNYLLDPVVKLQRFAGDGTLGLLIDESHQLGDRVRDMLSLTLERAEVRAALKEQPPAALARRLRGVDRALLELRRSLADSGEQVIDEPTALLGALERAMAALATEPVDLGALPMTRQLMFNVHRWCRSAGWRTEADFRFLGQALDGGRGTRKLRVSLACLDPAAYIAGTLAEYGPHVRFSGTVSPLPLYQSLHGEPDGPMERVASPFSPEQLATFIVDDVPVYYRQRSHSLPRLAELVTTVWAAQPGNYLVALPSFEYLTQLQGALTERIGTDTELLVQTPRMSDAEREDFLAAFSRPDSQRIGLVVLGGLFAESVDFSEGPLSGVISVGVGLPPVSTLRALMSEHFEERLGAGGGGMVAYQQPAMTRVLQMAGRLLRGPEDRGVLCLVDDRFAQPAYQRFFPGHWQPQRLRARELAARLEYFWQEPPGLPRLHGSS